MQELGREGQDCRGCRNVRAAQEPRELGQLPQAHRAGLNTLGGSLGGAVHHLLLHLGGPQPCAGEHIQGAYFACPLYRSGRFAGLAKVQEPEAGAVKREAEEEDGGNNA